MQTLYTSCVLHAAFIALPGLSNPIRQLLDGPSHPGMKMHGTLNQCDMLSWLR